jgi:hypothetical protein
VWEIQTTMQTNHQDHVHGDIQMWNMAAKIKQSIKDKFSTFHQKHTEKHKMENKAEESKE